MKLMKGILIGTMVSAGIWMMYNENMINQKKVMKKGKQMAKKMGIF